MKAYQVSLSHAVVGTRSPATDSEKIHGCSNPIRKRESDLKEKSNNTGPSHAGLLLLRFENGPLPVHLVLLLSSLVLRHRRKPGRLFKSLRTHNRTGVKLGRGCVRSAPTSVSLAVVTR